MVEEMPEARGRHIRVGLRSLKNIGRKVIGRLNLAGSRINRVVRAHPKRYAALGVISCVLCASVIYPILQASACGNTWTDKRLDDYFKGFVGHDGRSWATAYEFRDIIISDGVAPYYLFDSTTRYVIFRNCSFSGTLDGRAAIELSNSIFIRFVDCEFTNNGLGILSKNSAFIQVQNSSFIWNGVGIDLLNTRDSTFKNNTLAYNGHGIDVEASCAGDVFTLNNFTANLLQAQDKSHLNTWSQDRLGNYWDDYVTRFPLASMDWSNPLLGGLSNSDVGGVFIGSIPYPIPTGVSDAYPLVFVPNSVPSLSVNAPVEAAFYRGQAPIFQVNVTGYLISSVWYSIESVAGTFAINSSAVYSLTVGFTGSINQVAWSGLADCTNVTLHFYAANWFGRQVEVMRHVVKDSVAPIVSIINPLPNSYVGISPFNFSVGIVETHLDRFFYSLDGGLSNITTTKTSGTVDAVAWSIVPEGAFNFTVWAVDESGNQGFARIRLVRDSAPPIITIPAHLPGDCFGNDSVPLNISIRETSLDHVWLTVGSPTMIQNLPTALSINTTVDTSLWLSQPDGAVCISIFANDSFGATGLQTVVVQKDTAPPSVMIHLPSAGTVIGYGAPTVVYSAVDPHLCNVWWMLDSLPEIHPISLGESLFRVNDSIWATLSDGSHNITIWAEDVCHNNGHLSVEVVKDTLPPALSLSPIAQDLLFAEDSPTFNHSIIEAHPLWGAYSIDDMGLVSFPMSPGVSKLQVKIGGSYWDGVGDGIHQVTFTCMDFMGLNGSVSASFEVDRESPVIEVLSPTITTVATRCGLSISVNFSDAHLDRMWYTLDGGLTFYEIPSSSWSGLVDSNLWDSLYAQGRSITLVVYANDTLGHISTKSVAFTCEFGQEDGFPFATWVTNLSLFIIIGLLVVIVIHQSMQTRRLRELQRR